MKNNNEGRKGVNVLIFQYEALSQKETVPFFEKSAFWQIALHYQSTLELDKATTALEHALTFYAQNPEFHIFAAEVAMLRSDKPAALQALRKAQVLIVEEHHRMIYRIEAIIETGNTQKAIDELCSFKTECGHLRDTETILVFPEYMRNLKKTEVMLDYLIELLRVHPDNELALKQLYFCMEATGNYESVISVLEVVLEKEPMMATAWYNLGVAYQQTDRKEEALDAFEYTIIANQHLLSGHLEYAQTAFDLHLYTTALHAWNDICRLFTVEADYLVSTGECYEMLNQRDTAIELYQRAVQMDAFCASGHYKLGHMFLKEKEFKKAQASFKTAREIDPTEENYDLSLAATEIELGNANAALKSLNKAFESNPENPNCAIALIMLLLDNHKDKQAYTISREAMKYHNAIPVLTALRGIAVVRLGKKREGFSWIRTAIDEGLENTDLVYRFLTEEDPFGCE
jgi:tetratricopeptide (TPR) repeat protein